MNAFDPRQPLTSDEARFQAAVDIMPRGIHVPSKLWRWAMRLATHKDNTPAMYAGDIKLATPHMKPEDIATACFRAQFGLLEAEARQRAEDWLARIKRAESIRRRNPPRKAIAVDEAIDIMRKMRTVKRSDAVLEALRRTATRATRRWNGYGALEIELWDGDRRICDHFADEAKIWDALKGIHTAQQDSAESKKKAKPSPAPQAEMVETSRGRVLDITPIMARKPRRGWRWIKAHWPIGELVRIGERYYRVADGRILRPYGSEELAFAAVLLRPLRGTKKWADEERAAAIMADMEQWRRHDSIGEPPHDADTVRWAEEVLAKAPRRQRWA